MPFAANLGMNVGRSPVASRVPRIFPFSSRPVCLNSKMSWVRIWSSSIPYTSVMFTILREPSPRRAVWTIRSTAEAICSRIDRSGIS